jgi:molybdenum cofactor biosynthesis protein B
MSDSKNGPEHALASLGVARVTVSDTRTDSDDRSGALIDELVVGAGHRLVTGAIVRDDEHAIREQLRRHVADPDIDVVIATGGTGLTARDVTPEALAPLVTKPIPGFGELFRWLSYEEIGTSTIQSRAEAALCSGTLVFVLPGSPSAVRTALTRIVLPQLDIRQRPCNLAELLPRMRG